MKFVDVPDRLLMAETGDCYDAASREKSFVVLLLWISEESMCVQSDVDHGWNATPRRIEPKPSGLRS